MIGLADCSPGARQCVVAVAPRASFFSRSSDMPAPANTSRHVGPNKQSLTSVIKEITENHDSTDKPPDRKTGF